MGKEKQKNQNKMGIAKFWGWQARAISMGCMVIILGYLSMYCTDVLMIPAEIVGMMLLVSKVFDGITDLIAGFIIDNTHTKLGKARPYELCIIALWLCTWLLYSCPQGWAMVVKCIWVFIMYTLVNSVFATLLYSNQTTYLLRAFPNQEQIVKLNSYGGIVITIGCAVVSMLFPQLMVSMATSGAGWSKLVGIFALPLLIIGLFRFIFVKESVEIDNGKEAKVTFKDMIDVLKNNKYIYAVGSVCFCYNLILGMNVQTYYFKYIGGGVGRITALASLSMPLLIVMFIFPVVLRKGVALSRLWMFGAIIGVVGYAVNFFAGSNLVILMIGGVLFSFAGLPIAYLSGLMNLDCAEYNVLTGKKRAEATVSAISSFAIKIGQGVGAGMLGIILSAFGYDGKLQTQSATALMGIRCLYSIFPAILFAVIVIILACYKLDTKVLKELREKNNATMP